MSALNDRLPAKTAGALPSSRTEHMLAEALASDDIDTVKSHLVHTWSHYQSLEFALNGEAKIAGIIQRYVNELRDSGIDGTQLTDVEITTRVYATAVLEAAYDAAHNVLDNPLLQLRIITLPDALRMSYDYLDHTDPERASAIDLDDQER